MKFSRVSRNSVLCALWLLLQISGGSSLLFAAPANDEKEDVLFLRNQDRLSGLVLEHSRSFTLMQTPHGLYRVPGEFVRKILYSPHRLRRVVFSGSSRIMRVVEIEGKEVRGDDTTFTLDSVQSVLWIPRGGEKDLKLEVGDLSGSVAAEPHQESVAPGRQLLLLENGDRMSGVIERITGNTILLNTDYGIYRIERQFLAHIVMGSPRRVYVKEKDQHYTPSIMISGNRSGIVVERESMPSGDEGAESSSDPGEPERHLVPFTSLYELLFPGP